MIRELNIKRVLHLLVLSTMLCACQNTTDGNTSSDTTGGEITIETYTTTQSKGSPITDINYPSVMIWGIESDGSISDDINGEELMQTTIDLGTGEKCWMFSSTKYWGSRTSIDFIALSPSTGDDISIDFSGTDPLISYTTPTDVSKHQDLLLAQTTTKSGEKVSLNFEHILSKFNFAAYLSDNSGFSSDESVTINSIELEGLASKGTFNTTSEKWSVDETTADYSLTAGNQITEKAITTTTGNILTDDGYAMVIPYTSTPQGSKIIITYTVTTASTNDTVKETLELDLSEKLPTMESGYAYNFSITISKFFVNIEVQSSSLSWSDQDIDADLVIGSYILTSKNQFSFDYDTDIDDSIEVPYSHSETIKYFTDVPQDQVTLSLDYRYDSSAAEEMTTYDDTTEEDTTEEDLETILSNITITHDSENQTITCTIVGDYSSDYYSEYLDPDYDTQAQNNGFDTMLNIYNYSSYIFCVTITAGDIEQVIPIEIIETLQML